MSSILHAIEMTKRAREASRRERRRRQLAEPIAESCRAVLALAATLELDLDEVITAIRKEAAQSNTFTKFTS